MSDHDHSAVLLHLPLVTSVAVVHGADADVYELTFWDAAGSGDLAAAMHYLPDDAVVIGAEEQDRDGAKATVVTLRADCAA